VDTAQECCAVAVRAAGATVASRTLAQPKGHAEALLPLIAEVLGQAHVQYRDLHLLAATTGPGVFTGVRVGLAAVRGLRLALGIPAVGIGTLAATAATARAAGIAGPLAVVNDARRDEVYLQTFAPGGDPSSEAVLLPLSEAAAFVRPELTIVGTATALLRDSAANRSFHFADVDRPRVEIVAALADALYGSTDLPPPRPLYVRAPHITQPRSRA
jgi:tRNA threonylcarbamoyladenosine biosynthesis protein TsaB